MTSQLVRFIPQEQTFTWLFLKPLLKTRDAYRNVNLSCRVTKKWEPDLDVHVTGMANKLCARNALLSLERSGVFWRGSYGASWSVFMQTCRTRRSPRAHGEVRPSHGPAHLSPEA